MITIDSIRGQGDVLDSWYSTVITVYQVVKTAISLVKSIRKTRTIIAKEYAVTDVKEELQNDLLHFGDRITVVGTFSEYLPFVDLASVLEEKQLRLSAVSRTVRLEAIDDMYCGALFPLDQIDAFSEQTIPVFYRIDSPMLQHYTGQMLEVICKITKIPIAYQQLISKRECFTFEKEGDIEIPFGLEILKVQPYGLVDSFKISTWLLGSIDPAPKIEVSKKRTCPSCRHFFSFMAIDPLDWPLRNACSIAERLDDIDGGNGLKRSLAEFRQLDSKGSPYVVFPDPFRLYEVFCPNVDVLNLDQKERSDALLAGAVKENLDSLFQFGHPFKLRVPKKIGINIDFQYDQRKKLTEQSFDLTKIPAWQCPHYKFDPNWYRKRVRG